MTQLFDQPLYQVLWQTRRLYRRLAARADERLARHGITVGQRGVLEFVAREGEQTVPQMARRYDVSRQHIQAIVNELMEKRLVEAVENPAHRRSVLIRATARGRQLYAAIEAAEARTIARLSKELSERNLLLTAETLQAIELLLASSTAAHARSKSA